MKMGNALARPFLPTKDFELSKQFYLALGFELTLDSEVAIFRSGQGGFLLQRHYHEEWAANCMMQLMVDDLDAWWTTSNRSTFRSASEFHPPKPLPCSHGDCGSPTSSILPVSYGMLRSGDLASFMTCSYQPLGVSMEDQSIERLTR